MRFQRSIRLALVAAFAAVSVAGCSRSAQSYIDRGNARLADGKVDAAVLEFRSAVEKDPMSAPARVKLADAYARQGNVAGALAETVRAADLLPNDADAQLRAGSMLFVTGKLADARARAEKAMAIDPKNADAIMLRANVLAGQKDFDASIEEMRRAIALKPTGEWYATLGVVHHARGQLQEAEAAFRQGIATDPRSVPATIGLAKFLWGTGRPEEAETVFKAALALDPRGGAANQALANFYIETNRAPEAEPYLKTLASADDAGARLALAEYYAKARRNADALKVLEDLSSEPRNSALARSRAAQVMYSDGKTAEAHRVIDEVIVKQPAYADARVIRARFLFQEGKPDQALAEAQQAVKADSRNADAHFLIGSILKDKRDLAGAAASFNEALRINPRATQVQVELAELELRRGEFATATQLAEQAARARPHGLSARLVLARGLLAGRDLDRAATVIRELLAEFPRSGGAHAQAGLLATIKGDRAGARKAFENALALDPLLIEPLAALASLDVAEGQPARARARIEERLKKRPGDSAVLVVAARTWGATGDHRKAEEFLRRAIDADASNFEAYAMLGRLYVTQKRLDEALVEYDRLAARQRGGVGAPTMAGLILEAQGKQDEARKRYERLVEAEPQAAVASNNLAWMYATAGEQLDRALELARAAKAVLPDNPAVNDTLGFVYIKKQLPSLAIPPLRLAVAKQPADPLFHYHLGLAFSQTGDKAAAREALEQALKLKSDFQGADEARKLLRSLGQETAGNPKTPLGEAKENAL